MELEPFETTDVNSRNGRMFTYINQSSARQLNNTDRPFNRAKDAFNSLPKELRNMTKVDIDGFKCQLDKFIALIPDEPNVPGYGIFRASLSNSISDQLQYLRMGGDSVMASALSLSGNKSAT